MRQCTKCLEMRNDSEFFAYKTIMYARKHDNLPHDVCKDCYDCRARRKPANKPISELTRLSRLFLSTHYVKPAKWELTLC